MLPERQASNQSDKHYLLAIVGIAIATVSLIATLIVTLAPSEIRHILCNHIGIFCSVSVDEVRFFSYDDSNILDASLGIPPKPERRIYEPSNRFARRPNRAIYWEIDVRFPKSQAQINIEVDGTRYSPSIFPGEIIRANEYVVTHSTPGSTSLRIVGVATDLIDALPPGRHNVEISVEANQTSQRLDATFELY
jgi:hypothetical protein